MNTREPPAHTAYADRWKITALSAAQHRARPVDRV